MPGMYCEGDDVESYIHGLVQSCSNSHANTLELLYCRSYQSGLTHWGQVTNYVSNLTIIGSDNGLSPGQCCQAIIWTNAGILLIN